MSTVSWRLGARRGLSVACIAATLTGGVSFAPVAATAQGRFPQPAISSAGEVLTPVQYRRHGHWHGHRRGGWGGPAAAGIIGGLALGALAAGAYGGYGGYGGPVYAAPGYGVYGGRCWIERHRVYDGWDYVVQDVRVCR